MSDLPLTWRMRAGAACLFIPILVNTTSLSRVARWLGNGRSVSRPGIDPERTAQWVTDFLHQLPDAWYPTCLRRTAVLYYLLRRCGHPVQMILGVQRGSQGAIDAHAWLVSNGQPYLEPNPEDPHRYKIIARFPEEGTLAG